MIYRSKMVQNREVTPKVVADLLKNRIFHEA
jgi:hypothetical protein